MKGEQERLPVGRLPRHKGTWEKRAETLLRDIRAQGHLGKDTAGYGDALRMAGRDRDRVEDDPDATAWARNTTRLGWDHALSRIVPPPAEHLEQHAADDDPFRALEEHLTRSAEVGDPPHTQPAD